MTQKITKTLSSKKTLIALAISSSLLLGGWQAFNQSALARVESAPTQLSGMPASFADLVEAIEPAVVNISTTGNRPSSQSSAMPQVPVSTGVTV